MSSCLIEYFRIEDCPKQKLQDIEALYRIVWPVIPGAPAVESCLERERADHILFSASIEGRVVASASGFSRTVFYAGGSLKLLALASVCTHPDFRHRGLGAEVVRRVLALVDKGQYPLALWQTGVPDFYEKMGARLVTNRFINSKHPTDTEKNPFWDKFIMIYPSDAFWPEGTIDLNGLAY